MPIGEPVSARSTRDSRLNIRTSAKQDSLIRQAASALDKSVSEFVLESTIANAEHVLADRRFFAVTDAAWEAFETALGRSAVLKPRLSKFLSEDSIFESRI